MRRHEQFTRLFFLLLQAGKRRERPDCGRDGHERPPFNEPDVRTAGRREVDGVQRREAGKWALPCPRTGRALPARSSQHIAWASAAAVRSATHQPWTSAESLVTASSMQIRPTDDAESPMVLALDEFFDEALR